MPDKTASLKKQSDALKQMRQHVWNVASAVENFNDALRAGDLESVVAHIHAMDVIVGQIKADAFGLLEPLQP